VVQSQSAKILGTEYIMKLTTHIHPVPNIFTQLLHKKQGNS